MSIARPVRPSASPQRPTPRPAVRLAAIAAAIVVLASAAPALAVASPAPTASSDPAPAWPTTVTKLGTSVTFYGRGSGHGVGMSQYGARGRAQAGQTAAEILAAYYRGSTPGTTDPARTVRVLVLPAYAAPASAPLTIVGRGGPWSIDGIDGTFPADARLRVWRTTASGATTTAAWHLKVVGVDSTVLDTGTPGSDVVVRPRSASTRLQLPTRTSSSDTYRGRLRVVLKDAGAKVINRLGLDDYLRGVVPAEMPSTWPAQALAAQAIASRSYAVRRLHPTTGAFDLYDDTRSQIYLGVEAERASTDAAIDSTAGEILKAGKAVVNALYHSTGGGATENNEFAFVSASGTVVASPVSYLRGIQDVTPDGEAYDAKSPWFAWQTATLTRTQLSTIFRGDPRTDVGSLTKLDLRHRGVSGRLYQITLYGAAGTKTVSGDVFRAVFNAGRPSGSVPLRSNLFDASPLP
jgi:SpoIID/LytB domain protein